MKKSTNQIYLPSNRDRILTTERWEDLKSEDRRELIDILFQNDNKGWPEPLGRLYGLAAQYLLRQEVGIEQ